MDLRSYYDQYVRFMSELLMSSKMEIRVKENGKYEIHYVEYEQFMRRQQELNKVVEDIAKVISKDGVSCDAGYRTSVELEGLNEPNIGELQPAKFEFKETKHK